MWGKSSQRAGMEKPEDRIQSLVASFEEPFSLQFNASCIFSALKDYSCLSHAVHCIHTSQSSMNEPKNIYKIPTSLEEKRLSRVPSLSLCPPPSNYLILSSSLPLLLYPSLVFSRHIATPESSFHFSLGILVVLYLSLTRMPVMDAFKSESQLSSPSLLSLFVSVIHRSLLSPSLPL